MYEFSKLIWLFLSPLNFLLILFISSFIFKKIKLIYISKIFFYFGLIFFIFVGIFPTGDFLLQKLEKKYSPLKLSFKKIDGILILGGPTSPGITREYDQVSFNEAGERLTESLKLIKKYNPNKIIFSGGSSTQSFRDSHAIVAKKFFNDMGLNLDNMIFEYRSRNTYENILFSKEQINLKKNEKWILITSAFHMPRAMNVAKKLEWNFIPYPVDFRVPNRLVFKPMFFDSLKNFNSFNLASHEFVGLISYFFLGRTNEIF